MPSEDGKQRLADALLPTGAAAEHRLLNQAEFQRLANVPPEIEWFANLKNENTRRAYRNDVIAFMRFVGIKQPQEFRAITRAHVIAWRKELEQRKLAPASIRRKLSAQSTGHRRLQLLRRLRARRQCRENRYCRATLPPMANRATNATPVERPMYWPMPK